MAKTFREWNVQQHTLLPPSVLAFVPPGHLAHFVRDTVAQSWICPRSSRSTRRSAAIRRNTW